MLVLITDKPLPIVSEFNTYSLFMDPLVTSLQVQTAGPAAQRTIISFCDAYNTVPLTPAQAEFLSTNPLFARHMREVIQHCSTPDDTYELGKSILGKDFITPQEVMQGYGDIVYSDVQLETLHESRPNRMILEECKKGNFVILPAPPSALSLHDIATLRPSYFDPEGPKRYYSERFVINERIPFGWIAIRRTPVEQTEGKRWEEKIRYLRITESVPRATETAWLMITYALVHQIELFKDRFILTASSFGHGDRVGMTYLSSRKHIAIGSSSPIFISRSEEWSIGAKRDIGGTFFSFQKT